MSSEGVLLSSSSQLRLGGRTPVGRRLPGWWIRVVPVLALLAAPAAHGADWTAAERIETYAITGKSGAELYASIGENGPKAGGTVRALAHTTFTLTWTRRYEPQPDGACTLVTARPKLTIVYTFPKPSGRLSQAVDASWKAFIAGVETHERVHGDHIREMVEAIEATSVGLSVPGDPGCRAIRAELTRRLSHLSQEQRRRSRDFDRSEMAEGGNIHQLVLALVNGP